ncbi:MAG: hypothetical protein KTR28_05900 [Micavibrio sp.]|nr:hypothetical protein [Micavibrio sp.]
MCKKMTNELANSKNQAKRRAWPEKRRQMQAKINNKTRPWEKSTGPKSDAGKAKSSANALKHGARSTAFINLRKALMANEKRLDALLKRL